jgi:hypothetical protein
VPGRLAPGIGTTVGEDVLEHVSALGRTTTSIVLTSPLPRKPLLPHSG